MEKNLHEFRYKIPVLKQNINRSRQDCLWLQKIDGT